jgi:hypothetical protein
MHEPPPTLAGYQPVAYLQLSCLLSLAIAIFTHVYDSDATLGLFLYTPLFSLLHHVLILYSALREGRYVVPTWQPKPFRRPLTLRKDHAPILGILLALYALGMLLACMATYDTSIERGKSHCEHAYAKLRCSEMDHTFWKEVVQVVLGATETGILLLLYQGLEGGPCSNDSALQLEEGFHSG